VKDEDFVIHKVMFSDIERQYFELYEQVFKDFDYLEDEDLYTRVVMFGKNKNPTNLMFADGVDFAPTNNIYKATAVQNELRLRGEEGNYLVYESGISDAGYIDLEFIEPQVWINNVPIDNQVHQLIDQPIIVDLVTRTETRTGCHGISKESYVKSHTYFYYKIYFSHSSIYPGEPIFVYDLQGVLKLTISPNDSNMDYAHGIYHVPGDTRNDVLVTLSTAAYNLLYSTNRIIIDYDNVLFKIDRDLVGNPTKASILATYEYWTTFTNVFDVCYIANSNIPVKNLQEQGNKVECPHAQYH